MKASTRAFKERQQQIGYIHGMEKTLLPQDERLTSNELRQMTQHEASNYIDFLKQLYYEQKTFMSEVG